MKDYKLMHFQLTTDEQKRFGIHTGRPSFIIPDFAKVMLSNDPPKAAKCSFPIFVRTATASPHGEMTLVASRAPPKPA